MIKLRGAYFTVELGDLCINGLNGGFVTISRDAASDIAPLLQRFADTGEIENHGHREYFAPPADGGYRLFNND